jgi:hypothetical protein
MYSFATPPINLKRGQQIAGAVLIKHHLDQSLWWANEKHWVGVRSYLLYSFLQVHNAAEPFTSHGNWINYAEPKPFSWVKPEYVEFSSSTFTVQDHILTTAGDALTPLSHLAKVNQHLHWYLHLLHGVRGLLVAKWTQEMLSSFGLRDPNLV